MTLRTSAFYDALIPWQNQTAPNFVATIDQTVQPYVDEQSFLASLPLAFDIDYAVGAQLDVVGEWVGVSRYLPVPVANIFFSFDRPGVGFDQGYWKGPYSGATTIEGLDDETYRRLLRARILANRGTGTPASAQAVINAFFSSGPYGFPQGFGGDFNPDWYYNPFATSAAFVQDNTYAVPTQTFFAFDDPIKGFDSAAVWYRPGAITSTLATVDMSVTIGIAGVIPSLLDLEILNQNLLPVIVAGVRADIEVTSSNGSPLFGFDVTNKYIGGFDVGAWGVSVDEIAALNLAQ